MVNNTRLRIQFVKNRRYNKFVKRLKSDKYMQRFIEEYQGNAVLFRFASNAMRDYCLNLFSNEIKSSRVKTTAFGHKYLKVMK